MTRLLISLTAAFLLTACGGGTIAEKGSQDEVLEPFQINTFAVSDIIIRFEGAETRLPIRCGIYDCSFGVGDEGETFDLDDFLEFDVDEPRPPVRERLNGLGLFREVEAEMAEDGALISAQAFGAWMDHAAFAVVTADVTGGPFDGSGFLMSAMVGDSPRTNPTALGGGTWNGAMVGADTSTNESVKGHATIRIEDFAAPAVDVAFTKIRGPSGMRPSIRWDALPVADGRFSSPSIQGQFFGEHHGEVAGLFDRDDLIGAFGARRQ